jgi:hypothetical protein
VLTLVDAALVVNVEHELELLLVRPANRALRVGKVGRVELVAAIAGEALTAGRLGLQIPKGKTWGRQAERR